MTRGIFVCHDAKLYNIMSTWTITPSALISRLYLGRPHLNVTILYSNGTGTIVSSLEKISEICFLWTRRRNIIYMANHSQGYTWVPNCMLVSKSDVSPCRPWLNKLKLLWKIKMASPHSHCHDYTDINACTREHDFPRWFPLGQF